jgi:hypothetical protein
MDEAVGLDQAPLTQPKRLIQSATNDPQAATPRATCLQGQVDELIERICHLRAQNDERSDHQIEAEMHALIKSLAAARRKTTQDRRTKRVYTVDDTLLFWSAPDSPSTTFNDRVHGRCDLTLFCNGFREEAARRSAHRL